MQKVAHNQSVFDYLLQYTGSINKLFEFLQANNLSVTDDLVIGKTYVLPTIDDELIYNYLKSNNITPATAITPEDYAQFNPKLGIGTMTIGSTFVIAPGEPPVGIGAMIIERTFIIA